MIRSFFKISYIFSTTIAEAPPPPLQIPAAPYFPLFCLSTLIRVTIILDPLLPKGCPKETAPPFTSTLDGSNPNF
jgi:hypothetical protein